VSEDDESKIVACAEAGVAGYHMRTESLDDLLVLMRKVAAGKAFCSPRVSAILLRRLSALASQRQPAANGLGPEIACSLFTLKGPALAAATSSVLASSADPTARNDLTRIVNLPQMSRKEAASLASRRLFSWTPCLTPAHVLSTCNGLVEATRPPGSRP